MNWRGPTRPDSVAGAEARRQARVTAETTAPALLAEGEGARWLRELERELEKESPGARLLRVVVEDGSAEVDVVNSHGLASAWHTGSTKPEPLPCSGQTAPNSQVDGVR